MNLLHCMDIILDEDALDEIEKNNCTKQKSVLFVKYENALKILKYDNATETWILNPENRKSHKKIGPWTRNLRSQFNSIDVQLLKTDKESQSKSLLNQENLSRFFGKP